jgi:hypothetical protein
VNYSKFLALHMQVTLSGDDGDQVDCQIFTDFSQESTTSLFRGQEEQTIQSFEPILIVEDLYFQ